jgi:hypothetical protein
MKVTVFIFLVFFSSLVNLQGQYLIPWAPSQPAWVFPLFLEDAHGQKDTVYFGYDPAANQLAGEQDIVFGEQNFYIDTIHLIGGNNYVPYLDSIQKVVVFSYTTSFLYSQQFGFRVCNVYMPLIIRFDNSSLYDPNIPLPDQSPLPRAQCVLNWFYSPNYVDCGDDNVLITDTISNNPSGACLKADSLIIENRYGDTTRQTLVFTFGIGPWTGYFPLGVEQNASTDQFTLSPNPAADHLTLTSIFDIKDISIYNGFGQKVTLKQMYHNMKEVVLDTSGLPNGFYFLIIGNGEGAIEKKFIVSK